MALAGSGALALALLVQGCGGAPRTESAGHTPPPPVSAPVQPAAQAARVPAHYESAQDVPPLAATLAPAQFFGQTRAAYQAVGEIPQTIAQLPCYCHCDVGFGHKSLHSCFVDDHAAHCAVCVEEALMAYRLQKEAKLTPAQIRTRIIAQYGAAD